MIINPIDYSEKMIQSGCNDFGTNICWDCERACGKCPWSEVDEKTGKVKFRPVPGWRIVKQRVKTGTHWRTTEQIVECPLFIPTPDKGRGKE